MVSGGNWGELTKEVSRRESVDDEFTPIIRDAANVMLEPEKFMKRVFRGVPAKELSRKLSNGSSQSRQRQRRRGRRGEAEEGKQEQHEMDTGDFLAMWDSQRPASVRPQAAARQPHISPSGMAFHLQQGYTLEFAMGDGMLADGVDGVLPFYERQEAANVLSVGSVADKFFEPRPPPSARPRPPPTPYRPHYNMGKEKESKPAEAVK